jgi:DNA-directed RNA polymerase specialized sigma24 family protein
MSPLSIRRYRAERLLRADFERLRAVVIALAQRRLLAAGVRLDRSDLDAAYAQAWHGLYAALVDGQEIANPAGWLALVTYRRAIDEQRLRVRGAEAVVEDVPARAAASDRDLASALDDRIRLRQLMEGLRSRLSARELQAASLCYLQGLPRAQAAAQMGVSDKAMRRLMDGRRGRSGVAQKFGSLVGTISSGEWCGEQGSLMRGLAYGILDPAGERYRLALSHQRQCPACRSYVLSLRGLAAALPPVPLLLRWAFLGAARGAGAGAAAGGAGAGAGTAGAGIGGTAGGAAGAASATGAAGGGWLVASAGTAATKLAVGCLLALGVGAGCVALGGHTARGHGSAHAGIHHVSTRPSAGAARAVAAAAAVAAVEARAPASARTRAATEAPSASARAPREFGPELGAAGAPAPTAVAASRLRAGTGHSGSPAPPPSSSASPTPAAEGSSSAAVREFAPG